MKDIKTFLMFSGEQHGKAKEAVDLYVSLFPDSVIEDFVLHGSGGHETPGTVMTAMFTLHGRKFMAMDSAMPHQFNFTPSMSIFVDCDSEEELELFYQTLSAGGKELMPLDNYGFSQRFGWVNDRFGISWQLNLPH